MQTRSSTASKAKTAPASKAVAVASAKAEPAGAKVVILGTRKARGGHYQVLEPMIPTRHVSRDKLDAAVRLVLEPK